MIQRNGQSVDDNIYIYIYIYNIYMRIFPKVKYSIYFTRYRITIKLLDKASLQLQIFFSHIAENLPSLIFNVVEIEFELQSYYYFHFRTKPRRKKNDRPPYSPQLSVK